MVSDPRDNANNAAGDTVLLEEPAAAELLPAERAASGPGGTGLLRPSAVEPVRIYWPYLLSVAVLHLLAPLAWVPGLFSWSGVVACLAGLYLFGTLGINLGYHRLLTHRGLAVPGWLERTLAILGLCCLQDSPARWVAIHRMHHQHSDRREDPHSPLVSLVWGHFEWLFVKSREHDVILHYERYCRDLLRDPFYLRLERRLAWAWVYLLHASAFFLAGLAVGTAAAGPRAGVMLGLSWTVWGVVVRTVLVWHITWSVNSLSHRWGYQSYATRDHSRNNWLVALLSNGEGWHNNHHWDQRSAAHGHRWWEFDVTYLTIRGLEMAGLARDVARPRSRPAGGSAG